MNVNEAIRKVMEHEIEKGQSAYEMLLDGYDGDLEAYIADYMDDYLPTTTKSGAVIVQHVAIKGSGWVVEDGEVKEEWTMPKYMVNGWRETENYFRRLGRFTEEEKDRLSCGETVTKGENEFRIDWTEEE